MRLSRAFGAALCAAVIFVSFIASADASELKVTEFSNIAYVGPGGVSVAPIANTPPVVDQPPISFASGAANSAAFNANTKIVRLLCDVQCSVAFGASPTATTNNMVLVA